MIAYLNRKFELLPTESVDDNFIPGGPAGYRERLLAKNYESFYRVAHLLWERNMLTSDSKFRWWPGSERKLTANFVSI